MKLHSVQHIFIRSAMKMTQKRERAEEAGSIDRFPLIGGKVLAPRYEMLLPSLRQGHPQFRNIAQLFFNLFRTQRLWSVGRQSPRFSESVECDRSACESIERFGPSTIQTSSCARKFFVLCSIASFPSRSIGSKSGSFLFLSISVLCWIILLGFIRDRIEFCWFKSRGMSLDE